MPAEEYFLWRAFDQQSPIGDERGDVLAAITAAASLQAQGAEVSALDMLPPWSNPKAQEAAEDDESDPEATFMAFLQGRAAITAAEEAAEAAG